MTVEGTIQYREIGTGTWALEGNDGMTYELKDAPSDLLKPGLKVSVTGVIRDDIMTLAMIGPVLEVNTFELL